MDNNRFNRLAIMRKKPTIPGYLLIGLAACITLINLQSTLILVRSFWARVNLGLDLTDESFNLMNLGNSEKNSVWPYARVLGPIFNLLNKNISEYRLFGLSFLILVCFFGALVTIKNADKKIGPSSLTLSLLVTLQIVIILFIPSVFRYLLVTPGYQWLLIVNSILLVIILIGVIPKIDGLNLSMKLALISVSFILLTMGLARLSGGIIAFLSASLSLAWRRDLPTLKKMVVFFYCSILLICVGFLLLNYELLKNYASTLVNFSQVLPQAFSLKSEILEILLPVLLLLVLIGLSKLALNFCSKRISTKRMHFLKRIYIFGALPLIALFLSTSGFSLDFQLPHIFLAVFCLVIIISTLNLKIADLYILPLIFLPYLTLFGSSTPAYGNWQTILFCIYSLTIFYSCCSNPIPEEGRYEKEDLIIILLIISVLFSILANRISSDTYEKALLPSYSPIDSNTSLNYSSNKLKSIKAFRLDAFKNGFTPNNAILDLSYFHPGLALMLDSFTEPSTIYDRYFEKSLDKQVEKLIPTLDMYISDKGYIFLPVETDRVFTESVCKSIYEYLAPDPLANLLLKLGYTPSVKIVSVYRSDSIDLTLAENDVVLAKFC